MNITLKVVLLAGHLTEGAPALEFVIGPLPVGAAPNELILRIDEDTPFEEWVAVPLESMPGLVEMLEREDDLGKQPMPDRVYFMLTPPTRNQIAGEPMEPIDVMIAAADDDSLAAAGDAYRDEKETEA